MTRLVLAWFALLVACGNADRAAGPAQPAPAKPERSWQLADVAMLIPYPSAEDLDRLLQTTSAGEMGPLVPASWVAQIPKPLAIDVDHALTIAQLRVVSVRIDPCAHQPGSEQCEPVVRLSWQPFVVRGGAVTVVDAAVHTNYKLTAEQFGKLADELWQLRAAAGIDTAGPLGVHPILARQGTAGAYWTGAKQALLRYCGEKTLAKLTTMQLGGRTNVWMFSGVEPDAHGQPSPLVIPRIGTSVQTIAVHAQPPFQFDGGLFGAAMDEAQRIEPEGQAELNAFLHGTAGMNAASPQTHAMLAKVVDSTRVLELPSPTSTVDTVDCASCHIAQAVRVWVGGHAPDLQVTAPLPMLDGAQLDLTNTSKLAGLTNQLRAFGYFTKNPVISQRTINESALTALRMRRN